MRIDYRARQQSDAKTDAIAMDRGGGGEASPRNSAERSAAAALCTGRHQGAVGRTGPPLGRRRAVSPDPQADPGETQGGKAGAGLGVRFRRLLAGTGAMRPSRRAPASP